MTIANWITLIFSILSLPLSVISILSYFTTKKRNRKRDYFDLILQLRSELNFSFYLTYIEYEAPLDDNNRPKWGKNWNNNWWVLSKLDNKTCDKIHDKIYDSYLLLLDQICHMSYNGLIDNKDLQYLYELRRISGSIAIVQYLVTLKIFSVVDEDNFSFPYEYLDKYLLEQSKIQWNKHNLKDEQNINKTWKALVEKCINDKLYRPDLLVNEPEKYSSKKSQDLIINTFQKLGYEVTL